MTYGFPKKDTEEHFTIQVKITHVKKVPTGTSRDHRNVDEIVSVISRGETLEEAIERANRHLYVYLPFDEDASYEESHENNTEKSV